MIGYTPDIVLRGRELALTRMRATVRVSRAGAPVRDPATGTVTPALTLVYEGPAELQISDTDPTGNDVAGQRIAEQGPLVKLPMIGEHAAAAAAVQFDDVGQVMTDPDNPGNVGIRFKVAGRHLKSHATARRLPVEVVSPT
ncbi:DUF6093 family protein [Microbacterium rhizophilus]|uniref:DUF6093 family protein n=1 Tax=Microbacterium rhizophilus TaxID=3138934 RepID=UPI0031F0860C